MNLPPLKRITKDDYPDAPFWFVKLILLINSFFQNVYAALNRQLTLEDNIRCEIMELTRFAPMDGMSFPTKIVPATGVFLLGVVGPTFTTPPVIRWRQDQGKIIIDEITGLTANESYRVKLLVL